MGIIDFVTIISHLLQNKPPFLLCNIHAPHHSSSEEKTKTQSTIPQLSFAKPVNEIKRIAISNDLPASYARRLQSITDFSIPY